MDVICNVKQSQSFYDAACNIVVMHFVGDMPDADYKDFWTRSIDFGVSHKVNRVIINQQDIGNVSFNARAWVVMSAFPRVKKEMPSSLAAAIIGSERIVQKTGMQYLMKAFRTLTNYKVEIFSSMDAAIAFLKAAN